MNPVASFRTIIVLVTISLAFLGASAALHFTEGGDSFQTFLVALGFFIAALVVVAVQLTQSLRGNEESVQLPQP